MPTSYTDQFWEMDPAAPPGVGAALNVQVLTLTDQNDDFDFDRFDNDFLDGSDITASWPGDTVTVDLPGGGTTTFTGVTFYLADGRRFFTPSDNGVLFDTTFSSSTGVTSQGPLLVGQLGPPCFTPGTHIATPNGPCAVEDLRAGDLVETLDQGAQPVAFVHARTLDETHLAAHPRHVPVRIRAGALGAGMPARDLTVSPQHRILLRSPIAQRMFGATEVLAPAAGLIDCPGIERALVFGPVRYIHVMLDHHGLLAANGAMTESLYLGANVKSDLSRDEINAISATTGITTMEPARVFVQGLRLKRLLERHAKNDKPLVGEIEVRRVA